MKTPIGKSDSASIMGALDFLGLKLMTHANENHETELVQNKKNIYTNNSKLYSLHQNRISEVDGNGDIIKN